MSFNPFRSHKKKEQDRQALMKINKPSSKHPTVNTPSTSIAQMEDALKRLTAMMSNLGKGEMLMAALTSWPHPISIHNGRNTDGVNTQEYQFEIGTMVEIWNSYPVPHFIERHFNEAEQEDYSAILRWLSHYEPHMVMTLDMFVASIVEHFNLHYPDAKTEPVYSFNGFTMEQKDYFLPALKVLNVDAEGVFWSPVYPSEWKNNELSADHRNRRYDTGVFNIEHSDITQAMENCDCGIYASVNLEEVRQYIHTPNDSRHGMGFDMRFTKDQRRLCIIEPFSDATVWMARKGWKASKAFISEVIGETISMKDAAELLSMVWQRPLDLEKLYREDTP